MPAAKKKSKQMPCNPTATAISGNAGRAEKIANRVAQAAMPINKTVLHAPILG